MRRALVIVTGLLILIAVNYSIHSKEQLLATGRIVLLELAPIDPRSLMQGDYMALRFRVADEALGRVSPRDRRNGRIVVGLDARGVAMFRRLDDGSPTNSDEALLRYRVRANTVKFATNAYFFQEGHAHYYERARYGEFRASPEGELLLTGMRGENLEILGPRP